MRVAGLVVARTLELVGESLEPGRTTGELDAIAEDSIRGAGAVPSFKGYHGFPGSLCVSVNDEVVHGIPGERRLAAGDLVSVDCGAIVDGWHGDAARSWVVPGAPADEATDALVEDTRLSMWHGIGALRTLGIPARYVSGYIETQPPPGQVKLAGSDASHAWVSAMVPDGSWVDLDPTNNHFADSRYVVTGWGRDFRDVSPLKGVIFTEGKGSSLDVGVDVIRLDEPS